LAELVSSIKANGVAHPILVRPLDEATYQIIAGERRVRAGRSPTEEACAADAIVRKAKGEKAEAAAQLGWPLSKLDRGLALMNLAPQVRADLDRRTIRLPKFQVRQLPSVNR
jgi:ParB family chromosome partitioning protein